MSRHNPHRFPSSIAPYGSTYQQNSINQLNDRHRSIGVPGDFAQMPFNFLDDPLGPSLFGCSSLMPQSLFDASRPSRRNQLLPSSDFFDGMMMFDNSPADTMMGSMMSNIGNAPGGCYSSQVMVMSSTVGPDGRQHVEKYAKSSAGNAVHKIRETKEAYSNSASGVDKLAWERQLDTKARRVVKERNRDTGEIVSNDEISGMSRDDECEMFNTEWNRVADERMPVRACLHPSMISDESYRLTNDQPRQRRLQAAEEFNDHSTNLPRQRHAPRRYN